MNNGDTDKIFIGEKLMKQRLLYLFGVGVSIFILFLLFSIDRNPQQNPQQESTTSQHQPRAQHFKKGQIANYNMRHEDDYITDAPPPPRPPPGPNPNIVYQQILDSLNQLGISTKNIVIDTKAGIVNWSPDSNWGEYYGKPGSQSHPITPFILKQYREMKAQPQAIWGCYRTNWGLMNLYIKDDVVTGTLSSLYRNTFIGKLKDNILVGIWMRSAKQKDTMKTGAFQIAFTENWAAFKGLWSYKGKPPLKGRWFGKKVKCPLNEERPFKKPMPGKPGAQKRPQPGQANMRHQSEDTQQKESFALTD